MKKVIILAALACAPAFASAQTALVTDWQISFDQSGVPAWVSSTDNGQRGMALNPVGNLLVASTTSSNNVRRVNPATGAEVTPAIPNTGYTTSALNRVLNKVGVSSDGVVYVCNLALQSPGSTHTFNVYRHADETAVATVAYTEGPGLSGRLGDDLAVKGSGTGTQILIGMSSFATVALLTTTDGLTFTKTVLTPSSPAISGTPHLDFDPDENAFWFRNTGGSAGGKYDMTGAGQSSALPRPGTGLYGPFAVGLINGTEYFALGPGNTTAGNDSVLGEVYATTDFNTTAIVYTTNVVRGTDNAYNANLNGAGDVAISDATDSIYWLITNNVLARTSVPPASVSDWNLM